MKKQFITTLSVAFVAFVSMGCGDDLGDQAGFEGEHAKTQQTGLHTETTGNQTGVNEAFENNDKFSVTDDRDPEGPSPDPWKPTAGDSEGPSPDPWDNTQGGTSTGKTATGK